MTAAETSERTGGAAAWAAAAVDAIFESDCDRLRALLADAHAASGVRAALDDGSTVLHRASARGFIEGCELLLAAGADPLARDAYGAAASMRLAADPFMDGDEEGRCGRKLFESWGVEGREPQPHYIHINRARAADGRPRPFPKRTRYNLEVIAHGIDFRLERGSGGLRAEWRYGHREGAIWLLAEEVKTVREIVGETLRREEYGKGYFVAVVEPHPGVAVAARQAGGRV